MEFWEAVTVLHLWLSIPLKTRFKKNKNKKKPHTETSNIKKTRQAKVGVKERDPRGSDSRGVESI